MTLSLTSLWKNLSDFFVEKSLSLSLTLSLSGPITVQYQFPNKNGGVQPNLS